MAEPLVMPLLLGGFGFYGAIFLSTYLGINFEYAWLGLAVLCGLIVWRWPEIETLCGIVSPPTLHEVPISRGGKLRQVWR